MKFVAVRFTPSSLNQMFMDNEELLNDSNYWRNITHFIYHGLFYDCSGKIGTVGNSETTSVFNNPLTYLPWLQQLKKKWVHLKFVWALPPTPEMYLDFRYVFSDINNLISNLDIDIIEFNFTNGYGNIGTLKYELQDSKCLYWGVLPPPVKNFDISPLIGEIDVFVINSFGFFNDINTENEFSNSKLAFLMMVKHYGLPHYKVMVGIDTLGLIRTKGTTNFIPFKEIERKKYAMTLHRNYAAGSSYLSSNKETIYYDDDWLLHQKLLMHDTEGFVGIVVGELNNDLPSCSLGGIWTMIANYTFMKRGFNSPS